VSLVIVMPGPYSDRELAFQAKDVASALTYNASFDCNAAKVVITPKRWARQDAFIRDLERAFATAAPRQSYYPGARERWATFTPRRARRTIKCSNASWITRMLRFLRSERRASTARRRRCTCLIAARAPCMVERSPCKPRKPCALQRVSFWTTPDGGGPGQNSAYPFAIEAFLPPPPP
jgi:hypothetical protein